MYLKFYMSSDFIHSSFVSSNTSGILNSEIQIKIIVYLTGIWTNTYVWIKTSKIFWFLETVKIHVYVTHKSVKTASWLSQESVYEYDSCIVVNYPTAKLQQRVNICAIKTNVFRRCCTRDKIKIDMLQIQSPLGYVQMLYRFLLKEKEASSKTDLHLTFGHGLYVYMYFGLKLLYL